MDQFLSFMEEQKSLVLSEPEIRAYFTSFSELAKLKPEIDPAEDAYDHLVFDAVSSIRLIDGFVSRDTRVLEIGGGIGFCYIWLKHIGVDAFSIEPSHLGSGTYEMGLRIMGKLGIDSSGWLSLVAHEVPTIGRQFDLIFSNNVLEHIENLDESMEAMVSVLSPKGQMRHNCPNYQIPYEPHFGIPLVPLAPQKTTLFFSRLNRDPLWRSIHFVTSGQIRKVARQNHLEADFDRNHLFETFNRLDSEPRFREKHPILYLLFKFLKGTGALKLLPLCPPAWVTPIQFTLNRKS